MEFSDKRNTNKNFEIVLVVPNPYTAKGINDNTHEQHLGVLYIGTLLKKNNFKCKIIDAKVLRIRNDKIIEQIKESRPGLIGITMDSILYKVVKELCTSIKELDKTIKIILGGPHPTSLPKETLREFDIDAVVIGEGEFAVLEIANNLKNKKEPFKDVKGVAYKTQDSTIFNSLRPINKDIDSYPFPDYSLLPSFKRYKRRTKANPALPLLTSRGCPFKCTFCSRDVYKQKFLPRSAENVTAEIDYLVNHLGVKQIDIIDDHFLVDKKRAKKILEKIIENKYNLSINLQSGVRVNSIDEEIMKLMKKAGVYRIAFGIESGDDAILKKIKKNINIELTKKAGLRIDCFFMIGLPGDNAESIQKTIDFAKELKPYIATFSMAMPLPGTELFQQAVKEGELFTDTRYGVDYGYNIPKVNYILPGMNKEEILKHFKKAYRDFYLRPRQILKMLINVKSFSELKWLVLTGFSILKNIIYIK